MKLIAPVSIKWLSKLIGAEIVGNDQLEITGVNEIHQVEKGDVVFVDHPKYYDTCLQSAASCIIINNKDVTIPTGKVLLYCNDPFEAYLTISYSSEGSLALPDIQTSFTQNKLK